MFTVRINDLEFRIETKSKSGTLSVDGKPRKPDVAAISDRRFHVILEGKSYLAELISSDSDSKSVEVKVNGTVYAVQLKDQYDELLHKLGMDLNAGTRMNNLAAPMPGLVLTVHVNDGDSIKKGDPLVTLEAMKMENVLKATADATVRKIAVKKGQAVEKSEVLIYLA